MTHYNCKASNVSNRNNMTEMFKKSIKYLIYESKVCVYYNMLKIQNKSIQYNVYESKVYFLLY